MAKLNVYGVCVCSAFTYANYLMDERLSGAIKLIAMSLYSACIFWICVILDGCAKYEAFFRMRMMLMLMLCGMLSHNQARDASSDWKYFKSFKRFLLKNSKSKNEILWDAKSDSNTLNIIENQTRDREYWMKRSRIEWNESEYETNYYFSFAGNQSNYESKEFIANANCWSFHH